MEVQTLRAFYVGNVGFTILLWKKKEKNTYNKSSESSVFSVIESAGVQYPVGPGQRIHSSFNLPSLYVFLKYLE